MLRRGGELLGGRPGVLAVERSMLGVYGTLSVAGLVLPVAARRIPRTLRILGAVQAQVRRVLEKAAGRPPDETLLVLDATTGQNGIAQAQAFTEAVEVTGVALTKLDGTAKGGVVLAVRDRLGVPVKLIGLGEGAGDLEPFDGEEFAERLLGG